MKLKKQKKTKYLKSFKKIIFLILFFWGLTFLIIAFGDFFEKKISPYLPKVQNAEEEKMRASLEKIKLPVLRLFDADQNFIGKGLWLKEDIFVAPDHLWDAGNKKLYYQNLPIKILVRDFSNDVLFFKIKNFQMFAEENKLKKDLWNLYLPTLNRYYYWRSDKNIQSVQVLKMSETFETSEIQIENLISFDANLKHGDSGTPVFDESGKIFGIFIATDLRESKAYMIKSDKIFELLRDFLGK